MKCPVCNAENIDGAVFCDECGTKLEITILGGSETPEVSETSAKKVVLFVKDANKEIELPDKDEVTLGREDLVSQISPDIDLTPYNADECGVSRIHCKIARVNNGYTIEDLKSTNSTFVNKKKVEPGKPHPISEGDEIRLGKMAITFKM